MKFKKNNISNQNKVEKIIPKDIPAIKKQIVSKEMSTFKNNMSKKLAQAEEITNKKSTHRFSLLAEKALELKNQPKDYSLELKIAKEKNKLNSIQHTKEQQIKLKELAILEKQQEREKREADKLAALELKQQEQELRKNKKVESANVEEHEDDSKYWNGKIKLEKIDTNEELEELEEKVNDKHTYTKEMQILQRKEINNQLTKRLNEDKKLEMERKLAEEEALLDHELKALNSQGTKVNYKIPEMPSFKKEMNTTINNTYHSKNTFDHNASDLSKTLEITLKTLEETSNQIHKSAQNLNTAKQIVDAVGLKQLSNFEATREFNPNAHQNIEQLTQKIRAEESNKGVNQQDLTSLITLIQKMQSNPQTNNSTNSFALMNLMNTNNELKNKISNLESQLMMFMSNQQPQQSNQQFNVADIIALISLIRK